MIKTLIFDKTKNTRFRFFIYMSSICVQRFTVFEGAVLKLDVPWRVPLNRIWPPFPWKQTSGNFFYVFSILFILITINIQ